MLGCSFTQLSTYHTKINMSECFEVKCWTKHSASIMTCCERPLNTVGNSAFALRKELRVLGRRHYRIFKRAFRSATLTYAGLRLLHNVRLFLLFFGSQSVFRGAPGEN
jgi:hypothetical protein